jgi:hypothetical protein
MLNGNKENEYRHRPEYTEFFVIIYSIIVISYCFYTPRNEVVGGYTGFTMSVRPSVDKSYVVR